MPPRTVPATTPRVRDVATLDAPSLTFEGVLSAMDALLRRGRRPKSWRTALVTGIEDRMTDAGLHAAIATWAIGVMGPVSASATPSERTRAVYADARTATAQAVLDAVYFRALSTMPPEQYRTYMHVHQAIGTSLVRSMAKTIIEHGDRAPALPETGGIGLGLAVNVLFHPYSTTADRAAAFNALPVRPPVSLFGLTGVPGVLESSALVADLVEHYGHLVAPDDVAALYGALSVGQYRDLVRDMDRARDYHALGEVLRHGTAASRVGLRPTEAQMATWLEHVAPDARGALIALASQVKRTRTRA